MRRGGDRTSAERRPRPHLVTPENLVVLDYTRGQRAMKESYTHAIAAGMLEVDGVPVSYAVPNSPTDGLAITWGTHRYFKGNAQRVMISVSRFTKPRGLKIIRSAKFAPSDQK